MKTNIVLISGKQGSGKTTIGEALIKEAHDRMGYDCENLTFASTIYEMHDKLLKILENRGIKRDIVKDGPLLQLLGTEWGRHTIDENIWVKCLQGQINNIKELHEKRGDTNRLLIVVTDCRFKNEFEAFPEALRIRLQCDKTIRKKRCSMWRDNDNHPSEIDLDNHQDENKFDKIIYTDSVDVKGCVALIAAQLDKGTWCEKR